MVFLKRECYCFAYVPSGGEGGVVLCFYFRLLILFPQILQLPNPIPNKLSFLHWYFWALFFSLFFFPLIFAWPQ